MTATLTHRRALVCIGTPGLGKANVIASFAVSGGNLTELASSPTPLPPGAVASGLVVTG